MMVYIFNCRLNEFIFKFGNGDVFIGIVYILKDDCFSDGIIFKFVKFLEVRVVLIVLCLIFVLMFVLIIIVE